MLTHKETASPDTPAATFVVQAKDVLLLLTQMLFDSQRRIRWKQTSKLVSAKKRES